MEQTMPEPDDGLPATMTAVEIREPGGPEVLVPTQRPLPRPGAGEVLVRVAAAGVNRPDVMQRRGMYPPPPGASDIPGLEIAGQVAAVGEGVQGLTPGDRVCALVSGGGYAGYCVADARLCLPWPRGYDAVRAAALPETFFTVWSNVFDRARLQPGERLLVHGGSSGIGTTAIQLARAFRAVPYATAGSAHKCRACESLGAEAAINYREEDFVSRIDALTGGRGVDVVLDMVMGDYLPRNLKCLAPEGRLVFIAVQGGPKVAELNVLPIMLKRLTVTGSTLRPRSLEDKAAIAQSLRERVWPLLDSGTVAPVVHASFDLAQAARAHALMESSQHVGKILLTVA
jgi:putative PIG3 family NAD(P)H quinone oxidoreductase